MSSTPTGQHDKTGRDGEPTAQAAGAGAQPRTGTWTAAAARFAPVIAAAAAMTIAGLWGLSRDSAMGNDEVVSRWAALLSLRQLAHLLRHVDAVHGLYYLLLHAWMVVGTSPAAIRIPSVISMTAAAALMVIIGRRLTGSGWAGLFAGLIMALTPSISYYAQTARSYALVFACVLGATLALLYALKAEADGGTRQQLRRRWLVYGMLVTLGGYLNELSLLVLAAHAVTVLLARYGRRTVWHWAAAGIAAAVLVGPLVALSSRQRIALGPIARPSWRDLWVLYHQYFGATIAAPALLAVFAVVAVLPPRGWWRRRRGGAAAEAGAKPESAWWSRGGVSLPSVAAPLLLVPAALLLLESVVALPLYVDRYVLYGEAGAALLAGAGLYRTGRWLRGKAGQPALIWVPGAVVCICALLVQLGHQEFFRTPGSRFYNFGGPAFYIAAHSRPGDGVLFFDAFYRKARLGYPSEFRKTSDFAMAVPPSVTAPYQGLDKPFDAVRPLMLAHRRIWVVGLRPSASLSAGPMREESTLLLRDFSRIAVQGYRNVWVTLWLRR